MGGKEYIKALKLLKKFKYINENENENGNESENENENESENESESENENENENFEKNKIKELLIKLLKDLKYKKDNKNYFNKKDKYIFKILLYENGITKSRHNQENNMKKKKKLEEKKIYELDYTLKEKIVEFLDIYEREKNYSEEFNKFYNGIKSDEDNFYKEKGYWLIPNEEQKENKYIKYVLENCEFSKKQKEKIKKLINDFKGKDINVEEIKKVREKYLKNSE